MKITFVNHASFVCETGALRLLCDPWLSGSAFNGGWDLIAPTQFGVADFEQIDAIWLSHEHPDHFSPASLASVAEATRRKIVVFYKKTRDQRVVAFCRKLGYRTQELEAGDWVDWAGGVALCSRPVPLQDSWLAIRGPGAAILNLNDAVVHEPGALKRLRRELGPIDVLFTQFNYAAWRGNREDTALRRADARRKLQILEQQVAALEPRFTVPFASFSYFSHTENAFTNDAANHPRDAVDAVTRAGSIPVLLYPGDSWTVGAAHDNTASLARYTVDYTRIASAALRTSPSVPFAELQEAARGYIERVRTANDPRSLELAARLPGLGLLQPIEIELWDLGHSVRFSFERGLELSAAPSGYRLRLASDSLQFVFRHPWGIDTLTVNGRFTADARGLKRLIATFGVDALNNAGIRLSPALLGDYRTLAFLARVMGRKLWSLRRQRTSPQVRSEPAQAQPN
jgi:UDP-MurNAc hydroxylase